MKKHLYKGTALLLCLCLALGVCAALAEGEPWPTQLDDRIAEEGMWITWRVDEINDFHQQLGYSAPVSEDAGPGRLTKEEAIAAAPVTESFLDGLKVAAFVTADNETENPPHCWQIHFYADEWLTLALDSLFVQVDAVNGDILAFFEPGGNG